ncbi:MAG TPA: Ldh family oxidoreductase, partial [Mesotoga sp.]|nr:Ldh family oxidoreductase [Mesotoga sp.]
RIGHIFMAINVEAFTSLEEFKKTTGDILRELRASRKASGEERIYTAGEKEYLAWLERKDRGAPLNDVLRKQLVQLRNEFKLGNYKFIWE